MESGGLAMKPVVLARKHSAVNENLRHSRKCHDPGDHDDWSNPANSPQEVTDAINIQQRKRDQRAAHQAARREIRMGASWINAFAKIEPNGKQRQECDRCHECESREEERLPLKR